MTTMTYDEFLTTLRERFGESPAAWAFGCPACGDVATGADFRQALAENPRSRDGAPVTAADILGQECIGRTLGALNVPAEEYLGRGCDWTAYGLLRGPLKVVTPDGSAIYGFMPADPADVTP